MINSLTHRIISSENLDRLKMEEAIQWANICISQGIVTDAILILSTLTEKDGTWEIRNYLGQSLNQLGIQFLKKEDCLKCYIKSYILEILEDGKDETSLRELYQIYWEFGEVRELRNFYLLYWANESWKHNHENKDCYIEGYSPDLLREKLHEFAKSWIADNKIQYFNIDKIRVLTNRNHRHNL